VKYNDPELESLYNEWIEQLRTSSDPLKIQQLARVMRSKLTSIIASAQMLTNDLDRIEGETTEQQDLAGLIVDAARAISVILDAATDIEVYNGLPPDEPMLK
jgi:GTP1/Obg family GTP-binding protein